MGSSALAVVTLLVAASANACATNAPPLSARSTFEPPPANGVPGTRRKGAYPVHVEWDAIDAAGVIFIGDAKACRVPCTVWLREGEDARVELESPRVATVALPRIPGLDTYDEPPRIAVRPERGHPGAAGALVIVGGVMSAVFVPLSIAACRHTNQGGDSYSTDVICFEAALAAGVGVLVLVAGILIGTSSSWSSAEIEASRARRSSLDLRVGPGGIGVSF